MEEKIKCFLNDIVDILSSGISPKRLIPVTVDTHATSHIHLAWNNYYGSWIDGGWNNYYGSWSDAGWNNYYGSWSDAGWNNYYGSWSDGGWNNYYGSWSDANPDNGGCFLTTACVEHQSLADDCYELQTLRAIRDTIMTWNDDMKELVREYYRIAPQIVNKINEESNSDAIWNDLYVNLVQICVKHYENNDINAALEIYINTVTKLKNKYGIK